LTKIDRSDQSVLIGKSHSDYFIVSGYQVQDFEFAWQAFSGRKVGGEKWYWQILPQLGQCLNTIKL